MFQDGAEVSTLDWSQPMCRFIEPRKAFREIKAQLGISSITEISWIVADDALLSRILAQTR